MSLECGELVYTLEQGGGYFAFVYEVGVVGTTYRLLFSDGSLEWVDAKSVGKVFPNESPVVEEVEPIKQPEREVVQTHSGSEGDEILESIPLEDRPPQDDHYVKIALPQKPPETAGSPAETVAPEPWFHATEQPMETPLTREKPKSRRKRISMRVRPKPKKTSGASLLCCCRSKSYESI